MAEPILKWAGGKRQLIDELYARFPNDYNKKNNAYHEPFFGGGALFFAHRPRRGTINDYNGSLVNFYRQVRNNPQRLIQRCKDFKRPTYDQLDGEFRDEKNYFYQQRARFNWLQQQETRNTLEEAALLLYLNRTCFNGMYRENEKGEFNVPIGDISNPDWVRAEQIRSASTVLNQLPDSAIHNEDFSYVLDEVVEGDLVYFDPPYAPVSDTAYFTTYSGGQFGEDEQERVIEVAEQLHNNGVHVILSNSEAMKEKYEEIEGFHVEIVKATRSVNSDGENRGEVNEVVATNNPSEKRGNYLHASWDRYR
ncbi:DNA adenine methylase [Haladaptatus sp. ZSTT2]|uniref:DNA adenine methylase n=1 Tax=Haladaptatus sp. ZSTT2 TaxID=3120515 RepID=UPI00300ED5CD